MFVTYVEAIIYLFLYNLHDCTYNAATTDNDNNNDNTAASTVTATTTANKKDNNNSNNYNSSNKTALFYSYGIIELCKVLWSKIFGNFIKAKGFQSFHVAP